MSSELVYSVEVAIVRCPGDGEGGANPGPLETPMAVRYCDVCREAFRSGRSIACLVCCRDWRMG